MVIVGCTMSGKTLITRRLIETFAKNFHTITILTGTPHTNDWDEIGIRPEAVSIARLEELVNLAGEQYKTGTPGKFLLIVDDMIGTLKSTRGGVFGKLGTSGRHYGITSIWLTQDFNFVDKRIRGNVQDWIIMGCQARTVIKGVEEITPLTKKEFDTKYSELGEYDFLHISMYGGNKAVFSHKVPNYGYVERPIQSRRERAAQRFHEETTMRVRDEERKRAQVPAECSERPVLQEAYPERPQITYAPAATDHRTPAYAPSVPSAPAPERTFSAQPRTDGREREVEETAAGGNRGFRRHADAPGPEYARTSAGSSPSTSSSALPRTTFTAPTADGRGGGSGGREIRSSIL